MSLTQEQRGGNKFKIIIVSGGKSQTTKKKPDAEKRGRNRNEICQICESPEQRKSVGEEQARRVLRWLTHLRPKGKES